MEIVLAVWMNPCMGAFLCQGICQRPRIFFLRASSTTGNAQCGRDDDQRRARFSGARFNRATTLYPVGPRTRTMMQSLRIGSEAPKRRTHSSIRA